MSTQAARVVSAFIDILTGPGHAVEDVSGLTLAAVRAHQVDAAMTFTDLLRTFALIDIDAARALFIEVVPSTTVHRVALADVGAARVEADLSSVAGTRLTHTLIDIDTVPEGILDKSCITPLLWLTPEGPLGVLAVKLWTAVMDVRLTLVDIFTVVVVGELISRPTADLPLTAE